MTWKTAAKESWKAIRATLVVFFILEIVLRLVYFVRNRAVDYLPLPYMMGDDYGPVPPWLDEFRILEPDEALIWKNRPNVRRTYIDIFKPEQKMTVTCMRQRREVTVIWT